MNKQNIQKEIVETAKELGIGIYMIEEFITNPRILKFREVAIRNKEKEMLDDFKKIIDECEEVGSESHKISGTCYKKDLKRRLEQK